MYKLTIEGLHKCYGDNEVLKGVSLKARTGDVISLIGASGSGKSTFLRCINFLETPDDGAMSLDGQPAPRHGITVETGLKNVGAGLLAKAVYQSAHQ